MEKSIHPIKVSQWELKILIVLLGKRMYGLQIQEAVQQAYDQTISDGTLYTTLHRMAKKGFLEASWGDPSESMHGARRKFYMIAANGIKALKSVQVNPTADLTYPLIPIFPVF
jgi:DNA-binding PadR family transcriptional regulator